MRTALLAQPERPWQQVEIAYLNHGVGGQWSSPTLPELLTRLGSEGVHSVVAYACDHLVDGSETVQLPDLLAAGAVRETHRPERFRAIYRVSGGTRARRGRSATYPHCAATPVH